MHKVRLGELTAYVEGGLSPNAEGEASAVVLLHGFGAPGTDLLGLAGELELPKAARWVFPMAPMVLDAGAPEDYVPRAWWLIDIAELQVAALTGQFEALLEREPAGLDVAREKLQGALDTLCERLQLRPERIVLGGFSQGAMLATDLTLRSARPPGALAILSGTVLTRSQWRELLPRRRGLPVFQSHGTLDQTLPFAGAELLRDEMVAAGLSHEFVPFRGGHGIPPAVMEKFGSFVQRVLAPT